MRLPLFVDREERTDKCHERILVWVLERSIRMITSERRGLISVFRKPQNQSGSGQSGLFLRETEKTPGFLITVL